MLSSRHELLVDLFRECNELAPVLLAESGIQLAYHRAEWGSIDLSQATPTEYRADVVILLRDGENAVTSAVIIEIQRSIDRHKRRSWPAYVANLHARHGCPVMLLVLSLEPDVAAWARKPIDLGHPGFVLSPIVVDGDHVPRIIDRDQASKLPELSVLSAIAHPEMEIVSTAISVVETLKDHRTKVYLDLIERAAATTIDKFTERL